MPMTAINLDQDTLNKLDQAALFRKSSREEILREAVNSLAEYDRYFRESVRAGMKDFQEGRIFSDEEAQASMDALYQQAKTREGDR